MTAPLIFTIFIWLAMVLACRAAAGYFRRRIGPQFAELRQAIVAQSQSPDLHTSHHVTNAAIKRWGRTVTWSQRFDMLAAVCLGAGTVQIILVLLGIAPWV